MAKAAAVIGLVASIASLVDFGAKLATRIHEITSKSSDVPESFSALSTRLPLLIASLQLIERQAHADSLPNNVVDALQVLIQGIASQVTVVETCLSKITPPTNTTRVQHAAKALKSLAKEKDINVAIDKIHKGIDVLVLHETTQHVDAGERIFEALGKLPVAPTLSPIPQPGHYFPNIAAHDHSTVHLGDIYIDHYQELAQATPPQVVIERNRGGEQTRALFGTDTSRPEFNLAVSDNQVQGGAVMAAGVHSPETLQALLQGPHAADLEAPSCIVHGLAWFRRRKWWALGRWMPLRALLQSLWF
ncbi:hypothetical protein LTR51_008619 [Lithohypha guttulata]|nr:hypothetical protein LTR51_008619 [Lithohypha guttulata]